MGGADQEVGTSARLVRPHRDRWPRARRRTLAELVAAGSTWTEKYVIYGGINVIGYGNHLAARQWRQLQSGMVHHYAAIIVAGLFLLAVIIQLIMQL